MQNKKIRKEGWFFGRGYRHFDKPVGFSSAQKFITSPGKVSGYSFWPLLSYVKTVRRFRRLKDGIPDVRHKSRLICYAAHLDSQIYAYYALDLERRYALLRKESGIDDCVLGYRPGKGSNINMANAAFEEIMQRDTCSVFTMDIEGFFDNIDHLNLKKQWCRVLGANRLPDDHYNLFKAITRFSRIERESCLRVLGLEETHLKEPTNPLCSEQDFHGKICGREEGYKSLILTNSNGRNEDGSVKWKGHGIPQGTPISAVLSNISMIDFDIDINQWIKELGGVYLRYSDDIFIICPTICEESVENGVKTRITQQGEALKINDKTEITRFQNRDGKKTCLVKKKNGNWGESPVNYLGLSFDGEKKAIRHSTIARYQRRLKYAVRNVRREAEHFKKDKIRSKGLYLRMTDINEQSTPGYVARVSKITNDPAAKKQLKNHRQDLKALIEKENKRLSKTDG